MLCLVSYQILLSLSPGRRNIFMTQFLVSSGILEELATLVCPKFGVIKDNFDFFSPFTIRYHAEEVKFSIVTTEIIILY